jgi:hypothetical protein
LPGGRENYSRNHSFWFLLPPFCPSAFCRSPTTFKKTEHSVTTRYEVHGDAAMMTVAPTIAPTLHASIPFALRWGVSISCDESIQMSFKGMPRRFVVRGAGVLRQLPIGAINSRPIP